MDAQLIAIVRFAVLGVFLAAVLLALMSWLVRARHVSPFSAVGRGMRQVSDPFLRPIERQVVRRGGNPVHAGWWLVIVVAVVGVLVITFAQWVIGAWYSLTGAAQAGPRALVGTLVEVVYYVLVAALFIRVIGSWLGAFRYARWMRPAYWLTDWIVEPIRRVLSPVGQFDFSPLAAWLLLFVLREFVHRVLL